MRGRRKALTAHAQLKLRCREKLRRMIERAAFQNDTSMNTEIIRRLEASFRDDEAEKHASQVMARLDAVIELLRQMSEKRDGNG